MQEADPSYARFHGQQEDIQTSTIEMVEQDTQNSQVLQLPLLTQNIQEKQKGKKENKLKTFMKNSGMFTEIDKKKIIDILQEEYYHDLKAYYKKIIKQKSEEDGEGYESTGIFKIMLQTALNLIAFPLMLLIYLIWGRQTQNHYLKMRLLVRYTFPGIDLKTVNDLRSETEEANASKSSATSDSPGQQQPHTKYKIYSRDYYINEVSEEDLQQKVQNEDINQAKKHTLEEVSKFTFNVNSSSIYLLPCLFSIIYMTSVVFNLMGIVHSEANPDLQQMFGINFVIVFYLFINVCTNYYISYFGNYARFISEQKEITKLMKSEAINPSSFYLKFSTAPSHNILQTSIQHYGAEFNNNRLINHYVHKNSQKYQNPNQAYIQDWISGIGLFTQYIFQSQQDALGELPYLPVKHTNHYETPALKYYVFKFFNYWIFQMVLFLFMVLITVMGSKQSDYLSNKSDTYGQVYIIGSLWCNMILYVFIQYNNRKQRRAFESRLFGLQRLGQMIRPESVNPKDQAEKQVPTIDIFCAKSLKTWYDLRVMTMKYKISSVEGWNFLILTEFLLLSLEALSEFFDSNGNFIYTFPKMNAFFSILLIVGLVQRVLTFLLPSLLQFAKINEQFDSHKSILQQNLYRLEHLKIQFAFYINPSAAEKQFETNRISSENNKMEIYNKIVYEKIQQFHNEKKQFKEYEKNQQEKEQQFNHRNSLYNGSEPEETEDKFSIQEEYFEQLISQYKDIIYLMDNNPRKHKIYSMNLIPITYQLIYLFVITYTSSLISTVIKMYAKDVQQQCT